MTGPSSTPRGEHTPAPTCGTPHYTYTESRCTEPAGHYQRERDCHAAPLIINGRECGAVAWDEPKEPAMTSLPGARLSPRQTQALTHAATGATLNQIADRMGVTRESVSSLLSNAYIRLDVTYLPRNQRRAAAVRVAVQRGLINAPTSSKDTPCTNASTPQKSPAPSPPKATPTP